MTDPSVPSHSTVHPVEARICRWLLEVQDRSGSDKVPLTQSALAQMLGVRRLGRDDGSVTSMNFEESPTLTAALASYELLLIWARSSATEPNFIVPSGSLASIDPSV